MDSNFLDYVFGGLPFSYSILTTIDTRGGGTSVKNQPIHITKFQQYKPSQVIDTFYTPAIYTNGTYSTTGKTARGSDEELIGSRVLFLDVDVGKDRRYKTQKDAVIELKRFLKATQLPQPTMIVGSGGGYHFYWRLKNAINMEQWKVYAEGLKRLCATHFFHADRTVTADIHRLLRVPGTNNCKEGKPRPCKVLGCNLDTYLTDADLTILKTAAPNTKHNSLPPDVIQHVHTLFGEAAADDAIADPPGTEYRDVDIRAVVKQCGVMKDSLTSGGANDDEPHWKNVLSIVAFTPEDIRRKLAVAFSNKHPSFDEAATYRKLSQREALGPVRCATLRESNSGTDHCKTCPVLARNTSPATLTAATQPKSPNPALQPLPGVPFNFSLNAERDKLFAKVYDKDDNLETIPVGWFSPGSLLGARLVYVVNESGDKWDTGYSNMLELEFKRGPQFGTEIIGIVVEELYSGVDTVANRIMVAPPKKKQLWLEFLMSWVENLRKQVIQTDPNTMGWSLLEGETEDVDEEYVFSLGDRVFKADGTSRRCSRLDTKIRASMEVKGDERHWQAAMKRLKASGSQIPMLIVASSFAAPLMDLTEHSGVGIHFNTGTGLGKTSAMKIAMAVWGEPKWANHTDDTALALETKAGILNSLPMYWDEASHKSEQYAKILFRMVQGQSKAACRQDATLREGYNWKTMMISSGNESLVPAFNAQSGTATAGMARLFEISSQEKRSGGGDEFRETINALSQNYGHLGQRYASHLAVHRKRIAEEVEDRLEAIFNNKLVTSESEQRYWVVVLALFLQAAKEVNTMLGWELFDRTTMGNALIKAFKENQGLMEAEQEYHEADSLLSDYLNEHEAQTYMMDHENLKHMPAKILSDPHSVRDPVIINKIQKTREVIVKKSELKDWLLEKQGDINAVLQNLATQGYDVIGNKDHQRRLLTKTGDRNRVRCVTIKVPQSMGGFGFAPNKAELNIVPKDTPTENETDDDE